MANDLDSATQAEWVIRQIRRDDNPTIARIVRETLAEFKANHPGTVYFDPTTDHLFEMFQVPRSVYFVAEIGGEILGGGGIYPTEGLSPDTCELVKMYLLPKGRGIGLGRKLIMDCLDFASHVGYRYVYLESMPELKQALKIYETFGFKFLSGPMGNSGHSGCQLWMLKQLEE